MGQKRVDHRSKSIKDFVTGKTDRLVIRPDHSKKIRGHQEHISGSGVHDSRPKRMRTRQAQQNEWQNESF